MCGSTRAPSTSPAPPNQITTNTDRIQVSTAPGPDGIVRRIEVHARENSTQLGGVRAHQQQRPADRPADRRAALPHGRLRPVLARPRPLAYRRHHAVNRRPSAARAEQYRRHFPRHPRSRHRHHLRRRDAHRQAAAALSVGPGRLQGQGQFLHALLRHRHRHRRPAGAVPHHPVRGQGLDDVPGRRRARLGGAHVYRHRFRLLGQGIRHVGGRRAGVARFRRGHSVGDAARVPVRLFQPVALARALCPAHPRLARRAGRAGRRRPVRSGGRLRHRAHVACRHRGARPGLGDLSVDARLRSRRAADPDLDPAGGLDLRHRPRRHRHGHQRHHRPGAARRPGADRDADRLHGDAARLRRRHHPRHRQRRRTAGAGA